MGFHVDLVTSTSPEGACIVVKRHGFIVLLAALIAIMASAASVSAQQGGYGTYCPGALPTRLQINGLGQVTPGLPNVLRAQPYRGIDSPVLGEIPAGAVFNVYGGPSCYDGMWWWYVAYNGIYGWTPEASNGGVYWTTPYQVYPPPQPYPQPCPYYPQINLIGYTGKVTPGLPNRLRAEPSLYGMFLRTIPAGDTFVYTGGPTCADGMYWWQVNYHGMTGWTAQGTDNRWIEPVICAGFTNSRLSSLMYARVSPGLPNNLRVSPSTASAVRTVIPAGAQISIVEGPVCAEGTAWWRVQYGYFDGWTAEGQSGSYWIEPRYSPYS